MRRPWSWTLEAALVFGFGGGTAVAQPAVVPVEIHLADDGTGCAMKAPKKEGEQYFRVTVNPGDTIEWRLKNECATGMELGVGNFRAPLRFIKDAPLPYPLEEDFQLVKASAPSGQSATMRARVKSGLNRPMTWLYDILQYSGARYGPVGDPEIEIP